MSEIWPPRLPRLGIPARSAAVSAVVALLAVALAGAGLDLLLYRSLISGVDEATGGRVRAVGDALQSRGPDALDTALLAPSSRVVAIQIIDSHGTVVRRSGNAPDKAWLPVTDFGRNLRRGISDDALPEDDMRLSGQRIATPNGEYTVLVGGGSEAVEATARTVALLLILGSPIIVAVAAVMTYWLVRRSLQSVDAIRGRVAEISTSDLSGRVPVPAYRDEIAALAVTMNEMLARIEAGHQAQQRFVADASHELRSPLATIISGLEVAQDHPELLDADLTVNTLLPEALRMHGLIEDLLLLARADEKSAVLRQEEVALDELADVEVARARRTVGSVETHLRPTRLTGDSAALARVLRNLVDNAVRHARAHVAVEVGSRNGSAFLAVSDDGPGIAAADRVRVFERFVRLDFDRSRSVGGTGLGLSIVAEVVAAHGGTVSIDDRPGGGTRVTVTLPQPSSR